MTNLQLIAEHFECDCEPHIDIKKYNDWKKDGRYVKKGEHGLRLTVYPSCKVKDEEGNVTMKKFPKTTIVFCRHQTAAN